MRSLTVVKDEEGNVKIAQYGSVFELGDENKYAYDVASDYFRNWVEKEENLSLLKEKIKKIKFFTPEEYIEFSSKIRRNHKVAWEYDDKFLDASVGVHILDRAPEFNSKIRLTSYYKYIGDTMFAPVIFEIDFQKGQAQISINRRPQYIHQFAEPKEVKIEEVKPKRGRRKKTEEEQYYDYLNKPKAKRGRPKKK